MNIPKKNAPTAAEQAAEIKAWKSKPRTESEIGKAKQEEYMAMLKARKNGKAPLYTVTATGREYR